MRLPRFPRHGATLRLFSQQYRTVSSLAPRRVYAAHSEIPSGWRNKGFSIAAAAALGLFGGFFTENLFALGPATESPSTSHPAEATRVVHVDTARAGAVQLGRFSVADAVERVAPAVVNIRRTSRRPLSLERSSGLFGRLPLPFPNGSSEIEAMQVSGGSGFIVAAEGHTYKILTNSHVVQDVACQCERCARLHSSEEGTLETTLDVTLASGEVFKGTVAAADPGSDLALVCIESDHELPVAELGDSDRVRPGEFVIAVGSPLQVLSNSCSFGIVSSVRRDLEPATGTFAGGLTFLQVDCAINPGSSGGPLCDLDGKVLGVCAMKIGGVNASNMLGEDEAVAVEGISFAIPISYARKVMAEFQQHGQVRRSYIGLALVAINPDVVAEMENDKDFSYLPPWLRQVPPKEMSGLLIHKVDKSSPGEESSLKKGDVILSVDGQRTRTTTDFMSAIAFKLDGAKVNLQVRRAATGLIEEVVTSPSVAEDLSSVK